MTQQQKDAELRLAAEGRLQENAQASLGMDANDLPRLVHELQVHQIELEMQNGELRQTRSELEAALSLYTELYDFAPVGYVTLTTEGLITTINLRGAALLGSERKSLQNKRFASYISKNDQARWNQLFLDLRMNGGIDSTELVLQRVDGTSVHVQVDGVVHEVREDEGAIASAPRVERAELASSMGMRLALIDISARKQAEEALLKAGALQNAIFLTAPISRVLRLTPRASYRSSMWAPNTCSATRPPKY